MATIQDWANETLRTHAHQAEMAEERRLDEENAIRRVQTRKQLAQYLRLAQLTITDTIDGVLVDGLRFTTVPDQYGVAYDLVMVGTCPFCGQECRSKWIHSAEGLAEMVANPFEPGGSHECPAVTANAIPETDLAAPDIDELVDSALRELSSEHQDITYALLAVAAGIRNVSAQLERFASPY